MIALHRFFSDIPYLRFPENVKIPKIPHAPVLFLDETQRLPPSPRRPLCFPAKPLSWLAPTKIIPTNWSGQTLPVTVAGMQGYLGSGMLKGIGPKLAERIVSKFKEETFDIIELKPERLLEVPGIGMERTGRITRAWQEQKQVKEIMVFLHDHGVSTNLVVKIFKTYGDKSLETVQQNPCQLERDIHGVGFKTADRIAQSLDLPVDHPSRIEAGIVFALNEMIDEGHIYVPKELLGQRAIELLEASPELISSAPERLTQDDRVRPDVIPLSGGKDRKENHAVGEAAGVYGSLVIYLTPLYFGEKGVADRLRTLAVAVFPGRSVNHVLFPDESLSDEQHAAIEMALTHPVSILTGGPGTGKTTCLKALITTLEAQHKRYALASPTGRAAKRLSEASGRSAKTIHRLLEYSPMDGFKLNDDNPLDLDFLVVDEASMLDLLLTNHLLKAVRPGTNSSGMWINFPPWERAMCSAT